MSIAKAKQILNEDSRWELLEWHTQRSQVRDGWAIFRYGFRCFKIEFSYIGLPEYGQLYVERCYRVGAYHW